MYDSYLELKVCSENNTSASRHIARLLLIYQTSLVDWRNLRFYNIYIYIHTYIYNIYAYLFLHTCT